MATNYQGGNDAVVTGAFQGLLTTLQRNYMMDQQIRQQERQQNQQIQNELQKDFAKVSANGLRMADKPEFDRMYEGAKDKYYNFLQAKTPSEKRTLAMELNQSFSELNGLVTASKAIQERRLQAGQTQANLLTGGRGRLADYQQHVNASDNLPYNQIGADYFNSASYVNAFDESKLDSTIRRTLDDALNNPKIRQVSQPQISEYRTSAGLRNQVSTLASIPNDQAFTLLSNLASQDSNIKSYVDAQVASGANRDDVIQDFMVRYQGNLSKELSRSDVSGERRQPTVININNVPPEVQQTPRTATIGTFTSNQTRTFNEQVGIQGESPIYDAKTGNQITVARSAFQFQGYNIQQLPVDRNGNPLPTNRNGEAKDQSKVAGTGTFLTGTIVAPSLSVGEGVLSPQAKSALSSDVIIPYGQSDFINMGKSQRQTVGGLGRQGTTRNTQTNSVSSQQSGNSRRGILD